MEKVIIDTQVVDVALKDGKVVVEVPVVALLKELAKKTDNKIDDSIIEIVEKALS